MARDRIALVGTEDATLADYSRAIALGVQSSDVFLKRGELHETLEKWKEADEQSKA